MLSGRVVNELREPQGNLTYPYLIPAGGYDQLWCVCCRPNFP